MTQMMFKLIAQIRIQRVKLIIFADGQFSHCEQVEADYYSPALQSESGRLFG